jgi:rare lipoprotein A (peptidoglycan hydrolase)
VTRPRPSSAKTTARLPVTSALAGSRASPPSAPVTSAIWLAAAIAAGLGGCASAPRSALPPALPAPRPPAPPPSAAAPAYQTVPDAVPRFEPRSLYGNPPFYDVFGKRYYVMASGVGFVERGVASWYGPGFHKVRTSTGEIYDMYGMTAAHKSLPLPAYVRVTNLENGRSCVVRVNDRGPFVGNRIIDLSYTAAAKLDMLRNGTAMVEIRTLQPLDPAENTHLTTAALIPQTVTPQNLSTSGASGTMPAAAAASAGGGTMPAGGGATAGGTLGPPPPAAAALSAGAPGNRPTSGGGPSNASSATPTSPGALIETPMPSDPARPPQAAPPAAAVLPSSAPLIAPAPVTSSPVRSLYVQAGAFTDPANAERLADKLRGGGYGKVFVRDDMVAGRKFYRVRIGPVPDVPEFDRIVAALEQAGVRDAHLALD